MFVLNIQFQFSSDQTNNIILSININRLIYTTKNKRLNHLICYFSFKY